MFKKKSVNILLFFALLIIGVLIFAKNLPINKTSRELKETLITNEVASGDFEDLINFDYDYVYIFQPYQTISNMQKQIGFQSVILNQLGDNGDFSVLFTKGEKEVAYLWGYPNEEKYGIKMKPGTYSKETMENKTYMVNETININEEGEEEIIKNYFILD